MTSRRCTSRRATRSTTCPPTSSTPTSRRISTRRRRLVWIETPSNPLLNIVDIRAAAEAAHARRRDRRRRQHLRDAVPAAAARARRRPRRPLDDEVPRRPLRRRRRLRRDERPGDRASGSASCRSRSARCRARSTRWLVLRGIKTLARADASSTARTRARSPSSSTGTRRSSACSTPASPRIPGHELAARADARLRRHGLVPRRLGGGGRRARRAHEDLPARRVARRRREPDRAPGADDARLDRRRARSRRRANLVRLSVGIESVDDLIADLEHAPCVRVGPRALERCIDLHHLGLERVIGCVPARDRRTGRRSSTAARRARCRTLKEGLAASAARGRRPPPPAALAHPPRPRGRGRGARARAPRAAASTSPRSAPRTSSTRAGSSAPHAVSTATTSTASGASSRRSPRRTSPSSATACSTSTASRRPATRRHHVCYRPRRDAATRATRPACGSSPGRFVAAPDAAARHRPRGLARARSTRSSAARPSGSRSIHFGVADDPGRHLAELRARLDRWAGLVGDGATEEECDDVRARRDRRAARRAPRSSRSRCRSGSPTRASSATGTRRPRRRRSAGAARSRRSSPPSSPCRTRRSWAPCARTARPTPCRPGTTGRTAAY